MRALIAEVDRQINRPDGADLDLITFVKDRAGHDMRYAIDSSRISRELGWKPSLDFEEGLRITVQWYLSHKEWMDEITSGAYREYYDKMYKNR